jgi:hypothetical protein
MHKVHQFSFGPGHLPHLARLIGREFGAELVNHAEPDGTERHWFEAQDLFSFVANLGRYCRLRQALRRAGLLETVSKSANAAQESNPRA